MTSAPAGTRPRQRLAYIDWARGIAVLLMIEAHTIDAWTRASARRGVLFRDATVLGGFAAPLFLWLAGLAVVLAAAASVRRGGGRRDAAEAVCRRGLEIFILAFLFRLQAFIVSPGGHPITLFRVDILNIMGPAIVAAGLVWALVESPVRLTAVYACLAAAIAMAAPLVRTMGAVDVLPIWVQWYIRPAAEYTTFTAFPWAGFVFAGAALGVVLTAARERPHRLHAAVAAAGLLLAVDRLLHRVAPGDLRAVVVLDQLADLLRDSHRRDDGGLRGAVRGGAGGEPVRGGVHGARAVRAPVAVRVLDSRRAGVRVRDVAAARPAAAVGCRSGVCGIHGGDVRRGRRLREVADRQNSK